LKKWAGKYVIGLTGNIGTGKSVVRRMLEHLGAYGIDADALGHRAIAKGAPGYEPILEAFGRYVLGPDEQIDRGKLGRLVFSDPDALKQLEAIVHPLIKQAIDLIVRRSSQKVIVIEAIKIFETGLSEACDSIWMVYAPEEVQLARLVQSRGMSEKDALQRINNQPAQDDQLSSANVIIKNISSYDDTWRQVTQAWQKYVSIADASRISYSQPVHLNLGEVSVRRAGPKQADEIVEIVNRLTRPTPKLTKDKVMAAFGEKAFLLLQVENNNMGFLGWQVENLVARTTQIALDPVLPPDQYIPIMIREMERASHDLQCEVSLIVTRHALSLYEALWKSLGYELKQPQELKVLAWQEAADEIMSPGCVLFFKQLRQDRVLRPI
jgi:dephospho-CoA kinase